MMNEKREPRYLLTLSLAITCIGVSCSVPNLEQTECSASRNTVRRFYSLYFDEGLSDSGDIKKQQGDFLIPELIVKLSPSEQEKDYFTGTHDFPRAFRVGGCNVLSEDTAELQVVLLWKDDNRNEQAEVWVRTKKIGGTWLIAKVEEAKYGDRVRN